MASVGIRFEGNGFCRFLENNPIKNAHLLPSNVKISSDLFKVSRFRKGRVSMSMKISTTPGIVKTADSNSDGTNKSAVLYERVDQWMRDSVVEIVKNLREAPLLVHVYAEESGKTTMLKTEKAVVDKWPGLIEKWEKRETQLPEGVIFVEKLEDHDKDGDEREEEDVTRAWGIVAQGRGVDCRPVCYLLKTSKAGAGPGLGLFCTHFCLMKVQSFRETARSQFKNCWLLQGQ
ncbi:unnamed protein product [Dovyalis caffra]|uniref:DUF7804 domain-containing protein n=1 Tax=Dovyalis caffra TaxID=77055 RepID=A0AAV1RW12_9ROSI|nr:unnamed protein product [Dovyalis caffra]